jgi:hypothetical protein
MLRAHTSQHGQAVRQFFLRHVQIKQQQVTAAAAQQSFQTAWTFSVSNNLEGLSGIGDN